MIDQAELPEQIKAQLQQKINECKGVEGASDDDVARFLSGDPPSNIKGKCILSCLQEGFGLVSNVQIISSK